MEHRMPTVIATRAARERLRELRESPFKVKPLLW